MRSVWLLISLPPRLSHFRVCCQDGGERSTVSRSRAVKTSAHPHSGSSSWPVAGPGRRSLETQPGGGVGAAGSRSGGLAGEKDLAGSGSADGEPDRFVIDTKSRRGRTPGRRPATAARASGRPRARPPCRRIRSSGAVQAEHGSGSLRWASTVRAAQAGRLPKPGLGRRAGRAEAEGRLVARPRQRDPAAVAAGIGAAGPEVHRVAELVLRRQVLDLVEARARRPGRCRANPAARRPAARPPGRGAAQREVGRRPVPLGARRRTTCRPGRTG